MNKLVQMLIALAMAMSAQAAAAANYTVAPNGKDANPGSESQPFATLARARDEIRKLKQSGPLAEAVTVYLRGGIYALPDGFKLEAQDGGTAAAPVTWRAFQNEKPILAGGRTITSFEPYKGQILKADVGSQGFKGIYFRQLVFDGKRQFLARYPNYDAKNPYGGGFTYVPGKLVNMYQEIPGEDKRTFTCAPPRPARLGAPRRGRGVYFPALQLVERQLPHRQHRPRDTPDQTGPERLLRHPPRRPLLFPKRPGRARRAGRVVPRQAHLDSLLLAARAAGGQDSRRADHTHDSGTWRPARNTSRCAA